MLQAAEAGSKGSAMSELGDLFPRLVDELRSLSITLAKIIQAGVRVFFPELVIPLWALQALMVVVAALAVFKLGESLSKWVVLLIVFFMLVNIFGLLGGPITK